MDINVIHSVFFIPFVVSVGALGKVFHKNGTITRKWKWYCERAYIDIYSWVVALAGRTSLVSNFISSVPSK